MPQGTRFARHACLVDEDVVQRALAILQAPKAAAGPGGVQPLPPSQLGMGPPAALGAKDALAQVLVDAGTLMQAKGVTRFTVLTCNVGHAGEPRPMPGRLVGAGFVPAVANVLRTPVRMYDGWMATGEPPYAPLGPEGNPMSRAEVVDKCRDLIEPVLGSEQSTRLIETVFAIETVKDIREWRSLLQVWPFIDAHVHLDKTHVDQSIEDAVRAIPVENSAMYLFLPSPFPEQSARSFDIEMIQPVARKYPGKVAVMGGGGTHESHAAAGRADWEHQPRAREALPRPRVRNVPVGRGGIR